MAQLGYSNVRYTKWQQMLKMHTFDNVYILNYIKMFIFQCSFERTHFFLVFDEVEISLTWHLAPVQKPETGNETQNVSGRFMVPGSGVYNVMEKWPVIYIKSLFILVSHTLYTPQRTESA